jgi:YjbE family integral membrane protein
VEAAFAFSWVILINIIIINIVLSGDNAVVIAMASRNLPKDDQRKAIWIGSFGAIALRIVLTFIAVWLISIPFIKVIGALLLLWIAIKLISEKESQEPEVKSGKNLWDAIRTVILADFVMSLDNVLAIAAAAQGDVLMIVLGLAISIPLIIWGSRMIVWLMEKLPIILYLGAGILGWTAGEMVLGDKWVDAMVDQRWMEWAIPLILTVAVLIVGKWVQMKRVTML